jgi:hypothetical protein
LRRRDDLLLGDDSHLPDATVEFDVVLGRSPDAAPAKLGMASPATSYRDRARLRRRLRYLRRARELSFRDLGGFVFDAHRFNRHREDIVDAKLKGLTGMDAELRSLEAALADHRELMLLHEPGISVCPRCGTLHGSDANFCSGCGLPRKGAALPLGPRAPLPISEPPRPDQQPTTVTPAPLPRADLSTPAPPDAQSASKTPPATPDAPPPSNMPPATPDVPAPSSTQQ